MSRMLNGGWFQVGGPGWPAGAFSASFLTFGLVFCAWSGHAAAAAPENVLDNRAWEIVSPIDKNGGEVATPGGNGSGAVQAASAGDDLAFASTASFGEGLGAPPVSQYLARRGPASWTTANLSPPLLSGTYSGGAYQFFSADLSRALLDNGWSCRDGSPPCPAENPSLGAGAPVGYRNLYLLEEVGFQPLITSTDAPSLTVPAEAFNLALAGATPDLGHVVLSTCAALTAGATEVPAGSGCDGAKPNLYEWSAGVLTPLNFYVGQSSTAPGATLAAPSGAISSDGSRVYWVGADNNLYLRHAGATAQVDEAQGGGGAFQTASTGGTVAFFTKAGHLYRYDAAAPPATDLTSGGGVQGVLGASAAGDYVYYQDGSALKVWHSGTTKTVASGASAAAASDYPPASGTSRLSENGEVLAFLSTAKLTSYENSGKSEVYVYEAAGEHLLCASCRPSGAAPTGPSTIPGAFAAGAGPTAYRPRALSADGHRLFFDSADRIFTTDTNGAPDVYEWEAGGTGGCAKADGCVGIVSSGRTSSSQLLDASADGADVYFLTGASLLPADLDSRDIYDARADGGYPEPPTPIPCEGDECQGPPSAPDDPVPGTAVFEGPHNPPVHFPKVHKKHHHKKHARRPHRRGSQR